VAQRSREQVGRPGRYASATGRRGRSLQLVMGYRFPGRESRAAIELYPIAGGKVTAAARSAGLAAASIPARISSPKEIR
jgi:hypothetical protein